YTFPRDLASIIQIRDGGRPSANRKRPGWGIHHDRLSLPYWTLDKDGEIQVINNIIVYLNIEYSPDIQKIS
ncbi:MAG: hypothetical protein ABF291_00380, partial [Desulfobacterales bacterium]